MPGKSRERVAIAVLCGAAALHVLVFSAVYPFFNNVDEMSHFDLVHKFARGYWPTRSQEPFDTEVGRIRVLYGSPEYLVPTERLPGGETPPPVWKLGRGDRQRILSVGVRKWSERVNHEAQSPPVYYAMAAVWYRVGLALGFSGGAQVYWVRFLNAPLVALLVLLSYLACRDWLPERRALRLAVPALLAFWPQDAFYSIGSDVLSPILFCVGLMLLFRWHRSGAPSWLLSLGLGLAVSAALLVKLSNGVLAVIFAGALGVRGIRMLRSRADASAWIALLSAALAALLPVLAWMARNLHHFGDVTASAAKLAHSGWTLRALADVPQHPIFTAAGAWTFWNGVLVTFWRGEFVWRLERLAHPAVDAFYVVATTGLLAAAAYAQFADRRDRRKASTQPTVAVTLWVCVLGSLLCLAIVSVSFEYGASFYPSQSYPYLTSGRLITGALVPFMILLVSGGEFATRRLAPRTGAAIAVGAILAVVTLSEIGLAAPAYASEYNWFQLAGWAS
jgi:multisubunit Na+/H+ antiporter MnhB subunit